jgi:GMP synthase (glutamine-hydrolysing)
MRKMSADRPLVVLVAGEPLAEVRATRGGYPELIREAGGGAFRGPWRAVDLRDGADLPEPSSVTGVIVTGSSSSVTERAPWMLRAEEYLRRLVGAGVPTFGICFGHQLLGQALGGRVVRNPRGREIGTVEVEHVAEDPVLDPTITPYRANATHVDTVDVLPPGATVLARTALEPCAVVRFAEKAWGVQFHPEMDGPVIRTYLEVRRELIEREGLDAERLLATSGDALGGRSTLERFLSFL